LEILRPDPLNRKILEILRPDPLNRKILEILRPDPLNSGPPKYALAVVDRVDKENRKTYIGVKRCFLPNKKKLRKRETALRCLFNLELFSEMGLDSE